MALETDLEKQLAHIARQVLACEDGDTACCEHAGEEIRKTLALLPTLLPKDVSTEKREALQRRLQALDYSASAIEAEGGPEAWSESNLRSLFGRGQRRAPDDAINERLFRKLSLTLQAKIREAVSAAFQAEAPTLRSEGTSEAEHRRHSQPLHDYYDNRTLEERTRLALGSHPFLAAVEKAIFSAGLTDAERAELVATCTSFSERTRHKHILVPVPPRGALR